MLHDGDERRPKVSAHIMVCTITRRDQVADARASGTAEGLAWHSARDEVDMVGSPDLQRVEELRWVGEVSAPRHSAEVRVVGADRPLIDVGTDEDVEPARSSPSDRPPAPQNRSTAVGRERDRDMKDRTRLRSVPDLLKPERGRLLDRRALASGALRLCPPVDLWALTVAVEVWVFPRPANRNGRAAQACSGRAGGGAAANRVGRG